MDRKELKAQEKAFNAHRQYNHVYFKANDMDFLFQWIMGASGGGGCAAGEAYYAASRMREGDPESWEREMEALGGRIEARAAAALGSGRTVSARGAFLRASCCYRAVLATMRPVDPRFKPAVSRMRECFRAGAALLAPALESFEVPFEGGSLPGYFRPAPGSGLRPTLLMIGGAETFAEDLYFYIAPQAYERGWNFAAADLPGQGDLPFAGMHFRADTEAPVKALLDALLARPGVDPERLAAYGISAGGYFVPRAASRDGRIRACVANSLLYRFDQIWDRSSIPRLKPGLFRSLAERKAPFAMRMAELVAWRLGLGARELHRMPEKIRDFRFDPAELRCPTLLLIGEGEYLNPWSRDQQDSGLLAARGPKKKLAVGPFDEGAGSHCMGENTALMASLVFDWLEEVFNIR